jgi:hypothetical protein
MANIFAVTARRYPLANRSVREAINIKNLKSTRRSVHSGANLKKSKPHPHKGGAEYR